MYGPAFDRYLAPARRYPQLWRLFLGILVIAVTYVVLIGALTLGTLFVLGRETFYAAAAALTAADTPGAVLFILSTFAAMALGPVLAARLLHHRGPGTLVGRGARVLRHFALGVLAIAVAYAPGMAVWAWQYDALPGVPFGTWLLLLPVALAGLALQTGAEELVFRGYVLQQLAVRFRSPAVWMVLPSLAFAALHYDPARQGSMALFAVGATLVFGVAAADLVARTGSLGAAWGLHFANNAMAMLFLGTEGSIPGLALWRTPYSVADMAEAGAAPVLDLAMMLLAWIVARRLLRVWG